MYAPVKYGMDSLRLHSNGSNPGPPTKCPKCGSDMLPGESCGKCERANVFRLVRREFTLLGVLTIVAAISYFGTLAFASFNQSMKTGLGAAWYKEGERQLKNQDANAAVAAFRKAIVNDRTNWLYIRSLAHALEAAGRIDEARELLLQVRENAPEDPEINIELARIAAGKHEISEAVRYYHNALYGVWKGEEVDAKRQAVQRELIDFLINQHAKDQALPELLSLAAHMPDTVKAHSELGNLFLQVGDANQALFHFTEVLRHEPRNPAALKGAGEASFQLGQYTKARHWLARIPSPDQESTAMLKLATLVVESDPLEPRLPLTERNRRVLADYNQVVDHVGACIAKPSLSSQALSSLNSLEKRLADQRTLLTAGKLRRRPDIAFSALDLIYEAETELSKSCGPPQGLDLALLQLARKSRGAEQ